MDSRTRQPRTDISVLFHPAHPRHALITNSIDTLNALLAIISSGIDLDRKNAAGNTALHWAALNGHLAVVQALVKAGADVGVLNGVGQDAVFAAEAGGKEDVAE